MTHTTLTRKQTISQFTAAWNALTSRNAAARLASIRIGEVLTHRPKDMTVKDVFTASSVTFEPKDEGRASRWATVYRVYVASGATDAKDAAERLTNLDKAAKLGRENRKDVTIERARAILDNFANENTSTSAGKATGKTLIQVDKATKDALDEIRNEGESYDELLTRLMPKANKRRHTSKPHAGGIQAAAS